MTDVFKQLAERLDQLPEGYPATDSGVEIKILKKIFSKKDAEMALQLTRMPETAEQIAERLQKPLEKTREVLDAMARKGQIACFQNLGEQKYMLAPFLIGIYEYQVYKLDKELVDLIETYFPVFFKTFGGYAPAVARTLPVDEFVKSESSVQPYDNVRQILENAKSFKVMECVCRQETAIQGKTCNHTMEVCLSFSSEDNAFDHFSLGGRTISKDEALKVIEQSAAEGLVHNIFYNTKIGTGGICNCCSCCCGMFRGVKEFKAPFMIARSNYVATIDPYECSACGTCAEERCPMDAIDEADGVYEVQPERCIGCGVCLIDCPTESINLQLRPEEERISPPEHIIEWFQTRAVNRGLN